MGVKLALEIKKIGVGGGSFSRGDKMCVPTFLEGPDGIRALKMNPVWKREKGRAIQKSQRADKKRKTPWTRKQTIGMNPRKSGVGNVSPVLSGLEVREILRARRVSESRGEKNGSWEAGLCLKKGQK